MGGRQNLTIRCHFNKFKGFTYLQLSLSKKKEKPEKKIWFLRQYKNEEIFKCANKYTFYM